jgi:hypothetical protein
LDSRSEKERIKRRINVEFEGGEIASECLSMSCQFVNKKKRGRHLSQGLLEYLA